MEYLLKFLLRDPAAGLRLVERLLGLLEVRQALFQLRAVDFSG